MHRVDATEPPPGGASESEPDESPRAADGSESPEPVVHLDAGAKKRLRRMFEASYDTVWRLIRRMGVDASTAEDGAQQVFMTAARRLHDIPEGKERAFLCGVAVRVAARLRVRHKGREVPVGENDDSPAGTELPEALVDRKRQRDLLDRLLAEMDPELSAVLVLAEIEGQGKREIAEALGIPEGTAASRLRRAREDLHARITRILARRAP